MRFDPFPRTVGDWRLLTELAVYRILLISLLLVLIQGDLIGNWLGVTDPAHLRLVLIGYGLMAMLLILPLVRRRSDVATLALAQGVVDTLGVALILSASGGLATGLGLLLIPAIAAAAAAMPGRWALALAGGAASALVAQELVRHSAGGVGLHVTPLQLSLLILHVVALTTSALAVSQIAQRARGAEKLVRQVGGELERLASLSRRIVDMLPIGVAVTDANRRLVLTNAAGARLLDIAPVSPGAPHGPGETPPLLPTFPVGLGERFEDWQATGLYDETPFGAPPGAPAATLAARFSALPDDLVLIQLEDAERLRAQTQAAKLTALGRLSANIAHEIRNPLAAIQGAAQLLEETITEPLDRRLLATILKHTTRINRIVGDVLGLTRPDPTQSRVLPLGPWLHGALRTYVESHPGGRLPTLELAPEAATLVVRTDPDQLQQVLVNLTDNVWLHARPASGELARARWCLALEHGTGGPRPRLALDVFDDGIGMTPAEAERAFEPFHTTSASGTGLGLYLARELAALNGASLTYRPPRPGQDGGFRLVFETVATTGPVDATDSP